MCRSDGAVVCVFVCVCARAFFLLAVWTIYGAAVSHLDVQSKGGSCGSRMGDVRRSGLNIMSRGLCFVLDLCTCLCVRARACASSQLLPAYFKKATKGPLRFGWLESWPAAPQSSSC